ncbi:MAG: hypothetical protein MJE77_17570 [Proteobacteria bacterium]|nr:hypothetical protein [Pseudomonadota bacterium]
MEAPPYTRPENERKFLVLLSDLDSIDLAPHSTLFEDRYFTFGRMRLRRMIDSDSDRTVYKLCKKFPSDDPYTQPIVNIYLTQDEYEAFRELPGVGLRKRRYYHDHDGRRFGIDVFEDALAGLVLCEIEAETRAELDALYVPPFARLEVTENRFFTGGHLCRVTPQELAEALRTVSTTRGVPSG